MRIREILLKRKLRSVLGRSLKTLYSYYGKHNSYTKGQVDRVLRDSRISSKYCVFAYALFIGLEASDSEPYSSEELLLARDDLGALFFSGNTDFKLSDFQPIFSDGSFSSTGVSNDLEGGEPF